MNPSPSVLSNRWVQLAVGIVAMVAVTNFQYGWTFFVAPLARTHGWRREEIQVAFSLFVLAETWLVPIEAYLADRFGSRLMVVLGGFLAGLGWSVNSLADTLSLLYVGSILAGMGAGIVYGISMGSALRWFPDRRGLAAGLTAAAFGAGAALTVAPLRITIAQAGHEAAFLWFGLGQGLLVLLTALVLRLPQPGELPMRSRQGQDIAWAGREFTPAQMVATPVFWLMYVMMTLVTVGGLMVIAQLEPMAESFGVADYPLRFFGFTVTALTLAASLDRVLNGLTRPFFGWISDHLGRERTMFVAFLMEAAAILLLMQFAHVPWLFVLFSGLTFFGWGQIYSLFPALSADVFGRKYATTNYALLYTAKGTAALLVPLGSWLYAVTGSWTPVFLAAVVFDVSVALVAVLVLMPMEIGLRKRVEASP